MKNQTLMLAALGAFSLSTALFPIAPALAQDAFEGVGEEAAEEAVEAAIKAIEEEADGAGAFGDYAPRGPRPRNYFKNYPTPADYPAQLWAEGPGGEVRYTVQVDAQGKPTGCEVTQSSGYELFDQLSCSIVMERGSFEPALDEDRNPIAGEFEDSHYWSKRYAEFPSDLTVHVAWTLKADGTIDDCEVIEMTGEMTERMRNSFEREPCPNMKGRPQAPYRDEQGNPVDRRVSIQWITRSEPLP